MTAGSSKYAEYWIWIDNMIVPTGKSLKMQLSSPLTDGYLSELSVASLKVD
jgi:hypothetical protein